MEYKKALDIFIKSLSDVKVKPFTGYTEAIECVINAIDKQIPKKPTVNYNELWCPKCGIPITDDNNECPVWKSFYFCPSCGQAIFKIERD